MSSSMDVVSGARETNSTPHACIYESYHGFDASRLIYFVTHDFLPVTKPQGATKARLAPKGGSLTGERVRACGCDRGGSSCRLAPPPGPSSGASRHRSMVEIWVSASCLSAWAYADAAPRKFVAPPLCANPRDTGTPGHGHGGGATTVPHHQLTFCRVDSPDPTRSTPSPAIRSTTARTPTSGSSSSTSSSSRGASARTRGTSASARGGTIPSPPTADVRDRTRACRACRSGRSSRTAVFTA